MKLPQIGDIRDAAERLSGQAVFTPLLGSSLLDDMLDARILFKAECLQRTGSFKFRGAYNALQANENEIGEAGVVACSSGNHAQGVAEAARVLGMAATIVMPSDAPETKKACNGLTSRCLTHNLWGALEAHIGSFLDSVTVQDVVDDIFAMPAAELEPAE